MKLRLNCSGQKLPILLLISATLLHIATTPTSCAKQQQVATKGGIGSVATPTGNQLQSDLLAANFYSIKDGKTSARRIIQQSNFDPSNSTSVRGQSLVSSGSVGFNDQQQTNDQNSSSSGKQQELDNVELPKEEAPNNEASLSAQNQQSGAGNSAADFFRLENGGQMNDRQQTNDDSNLVQSTNSGNSPDDLNADQLGANGENNLMQQQMMINSFNSLVGNGALDDFVSSTAPTVTPVSSNRQQQQQQQQQQQSTTSPKIISNRDDLPLSPTPSTSPSGDQQQQSQFQDSFSSIGTVDSTTKVSVDSSSSQPTNRLVMQPLNQQQAQFTTSTGTPISSPNSISMSLDGMIVNSRPRGSNQQQSFDAGTLLNVQTIGDKKTKQSSVPQSRIGESSSGDNLKLTRENLRNSQADNTINGQLINAKASRRVPYSGVTFTSPVTKGQRTKPKASNQVGGAFNSLPQQQVGVVNGVSGPQAADLMAGLQLEAAQPSRPLSGQITNKLNDFRQKSTNQQVFRGQNNQMLNDNFGQQQRDQQNDMQLLQGFDEDQQQIQQQRNSNANNNNNNNFNNNNNVNLDSNTLEVMRNIINKPTLWNQQNSRGASPDDMVMSLMSSADGKERRLVMIARETLDSLQRFAAQNQQMGLQQQQQSSRPQQQSQQTATKSKTSQKQNKKQGNKPGKQQASRDSDSNENGASWWPNNAGQNMWAPNLSTGGRQQQNSIQTSTSGPSSSPQRDSTTQQQEAQQEVQLQTTTLAPIPFNGNALGAPTTPATTTTTAQLPSLNSVTTTQSAFTQESSSLGSFENAKDSGEYSTSNNQNLAKSNRSDSFREVPVISSIVVSKENSGLNEQQQAQQQKQDPARSSNSQTNSAKQISGVKSKLTSGKMTSAGGDKSNGTSKGLVGGGNGRNRLQSERPFGQTGKTGSGKKKTNNINNNSSPSQAGKQSVSNEKQIDGPTLKVSSGSKSKSNGQSQGTKKSGSRKIATTTTTTTTNGQQQISANRISEQTKRPSLNLSEESSTTPMTTTTTSSPATSSQTNFQSSSDQSLTVDQEDQQQQITTTSKRPPTITTTTTSSSPIISTISQQQFPTTQKSLADESDQQQQPDADNRLNGGATFSGDQQQRVRPSKDGSFDKQFEDYGSRTHSGSFDSHSSGPQTDADRIDALRAAIPGEPQLDYPIYASPPKTSFDCMSQSCPGGYYADLETQCQVFHICQNDGRFDTFLCPNGTIFSQQHFVCVWWWQVDCQQSAAFYKVNDGIYCNSMFPATTFSLRSQSSSGLAGANNARGTSTQSDSSTGGGGGGGGSNQIGGGNSNNLSVETQLNNGTTQQKDSFSNRGLFNRFNSDAQANENPQSGGSNSLESSTSTTGDNSNTASTTSSSPTLSSTISSAASDSAQDDKQNQVRFRGSSLNNNNLKQQLNSSENFDDLEQQKQQEQQQQQQLEQLARKA